MDAADSTTPTRTIGEAAPYGLLAEFEDVPSLLAAAEKVRDAGIRRWDVFSPFPVHGLDPAMGAAPTRLAWLILAGGITGAVVGLSMEWWMNAVDYPYLIAGKPMFSLPAFIPVVFELTILLASFAAVFGMLGFNRLPQLYHPAFNSERFRSRVTSDRFYIAIEADDPGYDPQRTRELLESLGAAAVEEVED